MLIKKYLPSKIVVSIFLIPITFIFLYFLVVNFLDKADSSINDRLVKNINQKIDTDGDGLEDWEENLIGTDKNKNDTDGDGLSDNLEVKTGSDPLDPLNKEKKNNEIVSELESGSFDYDYRLDSDLTNTEKLSYEFLEESVKIKKSGMSSNDSLRNDIANKIISKNTKIDINFKRFSASDLKIDYKNFNKTFILKLKKELNPILNIKHNDAMYLLNSYFNYKDDRYLDEMKDNISIYKKVLKKISKIKVPEYIKADYLKFLNNFSSYIDNIIYLSNVEKDVVSTTVAVSIHKDILKRYDKSTKNLFVKIKNYEKNNL